MSLLTQRNLAGGEISPALQVKVGLLKYQTGLKTARNVFVRKDGGVQNKPGQQFTAESKDSTKKSRLIPFTQSSTQSYQLEFGDLYVRVIRDGAYVLEDPKTITAITQAAQGVVTSNAHGYLDGDEIYIEAIVGMTQLNGLNVRVSDKTTNTFKLKYLDGTYVNTSAFTAYSSGGTAERVYTFVSPYAEADLPNIRYDQNGSVMALVDGNHDPYNLVSAGPDSWTLTLSTFAPALHAPTSIILGGFVGGETWLYLVTSVDGRGEESTAAPSNTQTSFLAPTPSNPHTISWTAEPGAVSYNVYANDNGIIGFVGSTSGVSFKNIGVTGDTTLVPPKIKVGPSGVMPSLRNFSAVGFYQQRKILGKDRAAYLSRIGFTENFAASSPLRDDDAFIASLVGKYSEIRHIVDLGALIFFTDTAELVVNREGDPLTPLTFNPRRSSSNGCSTLAPLVIDTNAIYVGARGSEVRNLTFQLAESGYQGDDLSVFASHLFENRTIISWAYQKKPNSIAWAVCDDGTMVSLTFVREQQIFAWTRHDTDGLYEGVSCAPEGNEDAVYVIVRRTINGRSVRYIERMQNPNFTDIKNVAVMDSFLTYDGRNTDSAHTLKLQLAGGTWTEGETLALVSSTNYFSASDVGRVFTLENIRLEVTSYVDAQNVFVVADRDIVAAYQNVTTTTWAKCAKTVSGLLHLEGKGVSIFADGAVVASPNNSDYDSYTVASGALTLNDHYAVIHIGLPFTSDIETLAIDSEQAESLTNKCMLVTQVILHLLKSRGIFVGTSLPTGDDPLDGLTELKLREYEGYDSPVDLKTGPADIIIEGNWNNNGRVCARQVDPLPWTVTGIGVDGLVPFTKG